MEKAAAKNSTTTDSKPKKRTRPGSEASVRSKGSPGGRSVSLSKLGPKEIIQLGLQYEKQRMFTQSIRCFRYLRRPPKDHTDAVSWWINVALLLEHAGKPDLAMLMYKMVLESDSENAEALYHLGRLYHQENESSDCQDRAIGYLERAVAFDKSNPQTWNQLGLVYVKRGFLFKAQEAFKHALHRDKSLVDCWLSLGLLNTRLKLYKEAQQAYDTAIELDNTKSASRLRLGELMRQVGNISKAIDNFKTAANLDPVDPVAQQNLLELLGPKDELDRPRAELSRKVSEAEELQQLCQPQSQGPGKQREEIDISREELIEPEKVYKKRRVILYNCAPGVYWKP